MDECIPIYSIAVPTNLLADRNISATAKLLYGVIESFQRKSGVCFATNERLAEEIAGCSERTISRCIGELKDAQYIAIETSKAPEKKASCRQIFLKTSTLCGHGVDKIGVPPRQNCPEGVDKIGDKVIHKSKTEKKTIDPRPVFVEWIKRMLEDSHPADVKNELYLHLVAYAEMRADSKSPLNTKRKVSGLLEDLLEQSKGDVSVMCDMLKTAKRRCWLSVHAPKDQPSTAHQPTGRDKEWL